MRKIIVPTGYMGSGSSAVTDLVAEYKQCVNAKKNYEYVFLHCPDGLFDLEDKLLIGNNAIRSDEAIRSFEIQMNKLYNKKYWWVGNYQHVIGEDFKKITDKFIKNITNFNYEGYWYPHEEVDTKMFFKLLARKPIKIISRKPMNKILKYKDGMRISLLTSSEFYNHAKKYINDLLNIIDDNKNDIILDQFLLPFNLHRIDNYFDDNLRVIVVSRDPRDVFLSNKYIWNKRQVGVPFPYDVEEFCKYYKAMRQSEKKCDSKKVLRVNFEDLIYEYDKTVSKIEKFLGYKKEDHINKKKRFIPDLSMKNTQLFNNEKYTEEVKVIEKQLKEYLYNFPYQLNNEVDNTLEFDD